MKLFRLHPAACLVLLVACGDSTPAKTPDAGQPRPDANTESPDAGTEAPDAGTEAPDAGTEAPDAAVPPTVNVIDNGGFEAWPDPLPESWFGTRSNIASTDVQKVTTGAFEGLNAVRLINSSTTHRRFTTEARSMTAGRYACTFQARGTGDIRNAFFAGDYSAYSAYTTLDTAQWTTLTYDFNLQSDVADSFELIFSVRNTSGEHLLLDDVRCVQDDEP